MNKMTYRLISVITALCCVISFPHLVSAQAKKTMKFGVAYPLSGAMAFESTGAVLGHRIAADEIMKAGGFQGRRAEFIVRDDQGNPELNTRFCRELIINEQVDWLLTGNGSAVGIASCAVAKQFKKPTFIIGGATEKITVEAWNPYIFRYRPPSIPEARAAARIVAEEICKGIKDPKIYWISWDYEYGRSVYEPFVAKLKELRPDAKIIGEAWPRSGETDYGPFIDHMISVKPDVLVNAIWAGGLVSLQKQGRARGLWDIVKLVSFGESVSIDYRQAIGMDMPEGMWGNTYDDPLWPNNEAQRKFYQLYYNFTGKSKAEPPSAKASAGYYMVHLINKAMEKARSTKAEDVCKAMEGLKMDTFLGPIRVREFDHQVTSYHLWGPLVKGEGYPYYVLDQARIKNINCEPDLYTKEEWLAMRKKAGEK